jgi:hypothetical protein
MSRVARIAIESTCLVETDCDLNRERPTRIEIEKPSDILNHDANGAPAAEQALSQQESGTNQADRRS